MKLAGGFIEKLSNRKGIFPFLVKIGDLSEKNLSFWTKLPNTIQPEGRKINRQEITFTYNATIMIIKK